MNGNVALIKRPERAPHPLCHRVPSKKLAIDEPASQSPFACKSVGAWIVDFSVSIAVRNKCF